MMMMMMKNESGCCFAYSRLLAAWSPLGGAMNTFRGGGAVTRMGRFLVVTGEEGTVVLILLPPAAAVAR